MNEHSFPSRGTSAPWADDLEAAGIIQSRLFPRQLTQLEGLDYYGECRPAGELGGDFFDFVPLPDNVLAVSVGDVSGHGISSAIMMSGLQAFLRALTAHRCGQIPQVVDELNRALCQIAPANFYATLFYAHVDIAHGQMRYVSAGHEPALLVRHRTGEILRLDSTGTVLGLTTRAKFQQRVVSLEPGDMVVAYTDGITDASDADERELGQAGLMSIIRERARARAADLVSRIVEEVDRFTRYAEPSDDRTAVVIRVTEKSVRRTREEDCVELAFAAA